MDRMTSAPAALSPVATTAQDGSLRQAGVPDFSSNAAAATGRWPAARTADWLGGRSAEKTSWKESGLTYSSGAVLVPEPVGYCLASSAGPRALSRDVPSTALSTSFSSVANAATKTRPTTLVASVAAFEMTAPP